VRIRRAERADEAAIVTIVERAYGVYVERIGMRPAPMDADYGEKLRRGLVHIAEDDGALVGLVVLVEKPGRLLVENVAVDPAHQGEGTGGRLLGYAERTARARGLDTLALFTHEMMSENLALYAHLGYEETERRSMGSFSLVYLEKRLA
jgi:GNAT superfamily N-acetyltransferase